MPLSNGKIIRFAPLRSPVRYQLRPEITYDFLSVRKKISGTAASGNPVIVKKINGHRAWQGQRCVGS